MDGEKSNKCCCLAVGERGTARQFSINSTGDLPPKLTVRV